MDREIPSGADQPNVEQLLQLGMQTARQGNKQNARMIFQQVLDTDKQNERAWLWMAAIADTPEDRIRYLQTILRINPNNQTAKRELDKMRRTRESHTSRVLVYGGVLLGVILVLVVVAILFLAIL